MYSVPTYVNNAFGGCGMAIARQQQERSTPVKTLDTCMTGTNVDPEEVDIRLAVGQPHGNTPIKIICPLHKERLGVEDKIGSLAVYRKNCHCYGCGFHVTRRYAALSLLLGYWDGHGNENSDAVRLAVKRIDLTKYTNKSVHVKQPTSFMPPPPDPYAALAFHKYLLHYGWGRDGMGPLDRLMCTRSLSIDTIRRHLLGYTGSHFTIPVYDVSGSLLTIRYRADDLFTDNSDPAFRKYDGTWGYNTAFLYPMPTLLGLSEVEDLWIVEGELDAVSANQAGLLTLTVTNGAGQLEHILDMIVDELPWLQVHRWIIATDIDAAGDEAARKLCALLGSRAVRARWSFGKDLCDYFAAGGKTDGIWYESEV